MGGHAGAEGAGRAADASRRTGYAGERGATPRELRMRRLRDAPPYGMERQIVGQRLGDERSRSAPRLQIPLGDQLLVRQQGRLADPIVADG